jgi:SRSO17 transposase
MISANQNLQYPIALILSSESKKTCASLARTIKINEHAIWRLLQANTEIKSELIALVHSTFGKNKKLYLILDDTIIAKIYSKYIEGSSNNYNSSSRGVEWGLCSIVALVTDGKVAIPINLRNWTQEEIAKEFYKSKVDLAKELIEETIKQINIDMVVMDGLYAREDMIQWLNERNIRFEMRMHANRIVESECGEVAQLRNHNKLQLKNRQYAKTIRIKWKNIWLYATAIKRFNKYGDFQIIYQVSNYDAPAEKHKKVYKYRWKIEKFFRTAKQHLGLTHCQSRKLDLQINHQLNVFFAYTILQLEQKRKRLRTPEAALKRMKKQKYSSLECRIRSSYQIFGGIYA